MHREIFWASCHEGFTDNPRTVGGVVSVASGPIFLKVESPDGQTGPYRIECALLDPGETPVSRINSSTNENITLALPGQASGFLSGPNRAFTIPGLGDVLIDRDRDRFEIPLEADQGMFLRIRSRRPLPRVDLFSVLFRPTRVLEDGVESMNYLVRPDPAARQAILDVFPENENQIGDYEVFVRPFGEYEQWLNDEFLPVHDLSDDPNGDGLPMGLVWALGLSSSGDYRDELALTSLPDGRLRFQIPTAVVTRRRDVLIQQSNDLVNWTLVPDDAVSPGMSRVKAGTLGGVVVTLTPEGDAPLFVRLQIADD